MPSALKKRFASSLAQIGCVSTTCLEYTLQLISHSIAGKQPFQGNGGWFRQSSHHNYYPPPHPGTIGSFPLRSESWVFSIR